MCSQNTGDLDRDGLPHKVPPVFDIHDKAADSGHAVARVCGVGLLHLELQNLANLHRRSQLLDLLISVKTLYDDMGEMSALVSSHYDPLPDLLLQLPEAGAASADEEGGHARVHLYEERGSLSFSRQRPDLAARLYPHRLL